MGTAVIGGSLGKGDEYPLPLGKAAGLAMGPLKSVLAIKENSDGV